MRKAFGSEDPMEMVAVALPAIPGEDAVVEMARVFVEEFALMGYTPERIMRLFKSPVYAGMYMVYHDRGDEFVRQLIQQVTGEMAGAD